MIEFDGTCGTCPLKWVDYNYDESTICSTNGQEVENLYKCSCPTKRRTALLAQLSAEDRDLMELGRRIRALPQGYSLIQIEGDTLEALRAAHVGDLDEDEGKGKEG